MATDDEGAKIKKAVPEEGGLTGPQEPAEIEGLEETGDEVEYVRVEQERPPAGEPAAKPAAKPHGEGDKRLKGKLKQREAELKAARTERDELRDKYLRNLAEMENLRKRFDRDRQDYIQYALGDFLKELLVVLDNFERALRNRDEADGKSFQEGVEMIHRQYLDLLKKRGLRPIEPKDKTFDPALQQAVFTEESEAVTEPEVVEELQRGYCLNDRLLRPALVKVLVPKKGTPE
ncbi:MAG: nucleotide exchange factor GrpE [Candidatus Aminicenantes bacterium RBG_16_63_16]|nr:MAG: nucleotide exchange factor GrpE [Candidatus Aminicenantes bacterium RBG_16_63_16]